ncbi:MAG: response regulator [bacterium]
MENTKPRVLVIDDDVDCLTLVEATLSSTYEIRTLADPRHTFELLNQFFPDLIVLDVMMPIINGYQLLEKLRKYHAFQSIPVMFLSAKGQLDDIKKGYELGGGFLFDQTLPGRPTSQDH